MVADSPEVDGTPCPEKSIACAPEPSILGAGCPMIEQHVGTEEEGKPCPGKLADGPPVVGPVPTSVAVVAGSINGDGTQCPDKSDPGCPSGEKAREEDEEIFPAKSVDRVVQSRQRGMANLVRVV